MQTIYYFNPENDLALASGGTNYTAPPRAARLRHDLRLLPAWLAQPGDMVLCHDRDDQQWLQARGLGVDIITPSELTNITEARIMPWGWSRATRRVLQRLGVREHLLPKPERIEAVHRLSHRRTTIAMHHLVQQFTGISHCPTPVELRTIEEVKQWAGQHPGCYLKLPWSGSGQGVYRVLSMDDEHLWQWCRGGLRRQGSLLCEAPLNKVQDFATEWLCHDGQVEMVGYSVFESDFHHQYAGGMVESQAPLHRHLTKLYPDLDGIVNTVRDAIAQLIAPHYEGHLGVDMMVYSNSEGKMCVNPCVEVNLRFTMGLVCSVLGERHGLKGKFRITEKPNPYDRPLTSGGQFTAVIGSSAVHTGEAPASP